MTPKKKPKIHDCSEEKCDGKQFNGMNFTCNSCGKNWFLTCPIQREDVHNLLGAVGMIKKGENEQTKKVHINDDTLKALQTIIGINTLPSSIVKNVNKKEQQRKVMLKSNAVCR